VEGLLDSFFGQGKTVVNSFLSRIFFISILTLACSSADAVPSMLTGNADIVALSWSAQIQTVESLPDEFEPDGALLGLIGPEIIHSSGSLEAMPGLSLAKVESLPAAPAAVLMGLI